MTATGPDSPRAAQMVDSIAAEHLRKVIKVNKEVRHTSRDVNLHR